MTDLQGPIMAILSIGLHLIKDSVDSTTRAPHGVIITSLKTNSDAAWRRSVLYYAYGRSKTFFLFWF